MKKLVWLMLKKEFQRFPRRILMYSLAIGVIGIIRYGFSLVVGSFLIKVIVPVYLFGLFFRTIPYIYIFHLMAKNYQVAIEDIAYVVYVKGIRADQLQMTQNTKEFIEEQCKDRNPG